MATIRPVLFKQYIREDQKNAKHPLFPIKIKVHQQNPEKKRHYDIDDTGVTYFCAE